MAPTTRSISVNVSSTSSAEDSQGSAHMSNNCAIALALLLIATGITLARRRRLLPHQTPAEGPATTTFSRRKAGRTRVARRAPRVSDPGLSLSPSGPVLQLLGHRVLGPR